MVRTIEMQLTGRGWRARPPARRRRGLGYVSPNGVPGTVRADGYVVYSGAILGLPSDVVMQQGTAVYGPLYPPPGTVQTQAFVYTPPSDTGMIAAPAPQPMQSTLIPAVPQPPTASSAAPTFNPAPATTGPATTTAAAPRTPAAPAAAPADTQTPSTLEIVGDPSGEFDKFLALLPQPLQDFASQIRDTAARLSTTEWLVIAGAVAYVAYERKKKR